MRTISYKLDDLKKVVIPIGYEGENNHTRVIIDAGEVFKQYPEAVVALTVQPPKGTMYPAIVTRDGDTVTWDVKDSDCASNGNGEAQFTFTNSTVVVKSVVTKIKVQRSLHTEGPAPDPIQNWLDTASETLEEADQAIEAATDAAAAAAAAVEDLEALDDITKAALAGDVGKALSPKTVENGVVTEWQFVEPGAGTDDYADLDNKPSIAGVTLSGNKTLEDLGIAAADDLDNLADDVTDVKTAIQGLDNDKYEKPSGGIPSTDMTQAVQDALADAESAYQKPYGGIPASDIADGVIPVVDSALSDSSENAVQNKVVKGALDTKAPVIINTATGNPAVFSDGGGMPLKSLLIPFTPVQSGTGDPSPQNIRPIVPWNGLTVYQSGADTSNPTETDIVFTSPVYGGTLDVVSGVLTVTWVGSKISDLGIEYSTYNNSNAFRTKQLPEIHRAWSGLFIMSSAFKQVIAVSSYADMADKQNGDCCLLWAESRIFFKATDYTTESAFLEAFGNEIVAYKLETPQTVSLTPTQITALKGDNTIWSDADGQMIVEYPADTETFIANQHRNFIAPELSSMIADTALVKNDFRIVGNDLYKITTAIASGGTLTPNTNCVKTTLAEVIKPLLT